MVEIVDLVGKKWEKFGDMDYIISREIFNRCL